MDAPEEFFFSSRSRSGFRRPTSLHSKDLLLRLILEACSLKVKHFRRKTYNLEEVFLELVGKENSNWMASSSSFLFNDRLNSFLPHQQYIQARNKNWKIEASGASFDDKNIGRLFRVRE